MSPAPFVTAFLLLVVPAVTATALHFGGMETSGVVILSVFSPGIAFMVGFALLLMIGLIWEMFD